MKVAVVGGRTILVIDDRIVDAAQASDGAIPAEPAAMFAAWPDLQRLTQDLKGPEFYPALDPAALDLPIPVPQQAFGIGVNYDGVPEVPDLHHRPERRGTHRVGRRIRPRTPPRSGSPPGVRVRWMEPEGPHSVENIDEHRYHAIRVELK